MKWNKCIILSSVVMCCAQAPACVDVFTPENSYMYSVYNRNVLCGDSVRMKNAAFWKQYFRGKGCDRWISSAFLNEDSRQAKSLALLSQRLLKVGDRDGAKYLRLLAMMKKLSPQNAWDYPTKAQLQERRLGWKRLLMEASHCIPSSRRLADRYWLMSIRAAFYSGSKSSCKNLWNAYQTKFSYSDLRVIAEGYLAAGWYEGGQKEKAREFYARTGDIQSLRWCLNDQTGLKGIRALYEETPNSVGFPYLLQDYVNSMDADMQGSNWLSPVEMDSVRRVVSAEALEFRKFAALVVREGKTSCPAVWTSAAAYTAYLAGQNEEALRLLDETAHMKAEPRVRDNVRALLFLVMSDKGKYDSNFDAYVLGELKWLQAMSKAEPQYICDGRSGWVRNHYTDVMQRIVFGHLTKGYLKAGRFSVAAVLTGMVHETVCLTNQEILHATAPADPENHPIWTEDYDNELFNLLDTADVKDVVAFAELVAHPEKGSQLEQFAASQCYQNEDYYNELIGTKYLRLQQYADAIRYLHPVSLKYLSSMNIAPYLHANYALPAWFNYLNRKSVRQYRYRVGLFTFNPKEAFAREMLQIEQSLASAANDAERAELLYRKAEYCMQASLKGNCWALLNYRWTAYPTKLVSGRQEPFVEEAIKTLERCKALSDNNEELKMKCLFALASLSPQPWKEQTYDKEYNLVWAYHLDGLQAQCFAELAKKRTSPLFVHLGLSRCDNLKNYFEYR